jgi:hypothetical protein
MSIRERQKKSKYDFTFATTKEESDSSNEIIRLLEPINDLKKIF